VSPDESSRLRAFSLSLFNALPSVQPPVRKPFARVAPGFRRLLLCADAPFFHAHPTPSESSAPALAVFHLFSTLPGLNDRAGFCFADRMRPLSADPPSAVDLFRRRPRESPFLCSSVSFSRRSLPPLLFFFFQQPLNAVDRILSPRWRFSCSHPASEKIHSPAPSSLSTAVSRYSVLCRSPCDRLPVFCCSRPFCRGRLMLHPPNAPSSLFSLPFPFARRGVPSCCRGTTLLPQPVPPFFFLARALQPSHDSACFRPFPYTPLFSRAG